MNNNEFCLWLTEIKGIGIKKRKKLLEYFKEPYDILSCNIKEFENIEGISRKDIESIAIARKKEYIESNVIKQLEQLEGGNIRYVNYYSEEYPDRLRNIYDYPMGLYVRGRLPDNKTPVVAIVGARNCSEYGKMVAKKFSQELASAGVSVISGMARGIDSAAHCGALSAGGKSFGVLGCGIDRCYPLENINIFTECIKQGGIISEYGVGVKPLAGNFPMRNRIISGLSDLVLVVEAKEKSGSLITADMALEQGRSVMAVPGRIVDKCSEGCNKLIAGGAITALSTMDVIDELENCGFSFKNNTNEKKEIKNIFLETCEKIVYDRLCLIPKNISKIMEETRMEYQKVVKILIKLELMDYAVETAKGYYRRID